MDLIDVQNIISKTGQREPLLVPKDVAAQLDAGWRLSDETAANLREATRRAQVARAELKVDLACGRQPDEAPHLADHKLDYAIQAVGWRAPFSRAQIVQIAVETVIEHGWRPSEAMLADRAGLMELARVAMLERPYAPDETLTGAFSFELIAPDEEEIERTNADALALPGEHESPLAEAAGGVAFDVEKEPGLLGDLARWSLNYAFQPVREFALFSALAVLSPIFGRRFVTPTGSGLNIYMVALANTGSGKEAVLQAPQAMLDAADLSHLLGPGSFTSDTAIEQILRSHPSVLLPLDELGELLTAVQAKNAASWTKTCRKAILEIYSKSGPHGRHTGKQMAGDGIDKASMPIFSPTMTILGCSTVQGFFESLTEANFADGLLNRMLFMRGGRPGKRNTSATRTQIPRSLLDAVQATCDAISQCQGNLAGGNARVAERKPDLHAVPWADQAAEEAWAAVCDWQDDARDAGREGVTARVAENTLKLATIRALSRDPAAPAVTDEDVSWAWSFVRSSIEVVEEGARENMASSEFETLVKAIDRAVVAAGLEGITRSTLLRARGVAKHDDRMVDAAIKRLESTERVHAEVGDIKAPGRPKARLISRDFVDVVPA